MNWLISGKSNDISVSCKFFSFPHIHTASGSSGSQGGHDALLAAPPEMNWFPWWSKPKSYVLLRTSHLSPVLRMSVEDQTVHRYGPDPLHRSEFHLISLFGSFLTKSIREQRLRMLSEWKMRASKVLACSIPQTPRSQHEAVRPERVIPKAQGHLIGREGALSQEPSCGPLAPWCRHSERGILEGQGQWDDRNVRDGEDQSVITVSCSLLLEGMINPCTTCASQVSQCTYGMYLHRVTRKGKYERENLVQQESQFPLRLFQSLGQPRL